ncbi:MAG: hypothetical protein NTZ59_02290 [Bacteroidetes bacterium]|nr:hypothetical protein [Bacteroidota bacterium]
MTKEQSKTLNDAAKGKIKNEAVLSGGSKYVNPIRKPQPKKKNFWQKLFS